MKLYTKPGACSTADHIALQWTGQPFEIEVVSAEERRSRRHTWRSIPPARCRRCVDGDFVLTQNAAILGYIADTYPDARLGGDGSPRQRAEAARWLALPTPTCIRPSIRCSGLRASWPTRASTKRVKASRPQAPARDRSSAPNKQLDGKQWIAGFRSFADPYLYITLRWAQKTHVDLSGFDNLEAFKRRMDEDSGVRAALRAEGLA